jgi:hypothetical protein
MASEPARKPPVRIQSRDERITVRLTSAERADWIAAAGKADEELSRFFRRCAVIGRKVREANFLAQAAGE